MRDSRNFQATRKFQMKISLLHPSCLFALVMALAIPTSSAVSEPMSKVYDCDGRKMEVFEPKDGVMEARVEDLTVRISVRDRGPFSPASYSVSLDGHVQSSAQHADEILPTACDLISMHYMNLKAPSEEALIEQLVELYDLL